MLSRAQTGMKIIFTAVMVILVLIIFIYGYKYTVGLKTKLKSEGLIEKQELTGNWSEFKMPDGGAELVDCYVGEKDGEDVMKKYPVKLCPTDLDDIDENRIIYEAYLVANSGKYGEGDFKVQNVFLGDCAQCYSVGLSDGTRNVMISLNGLMEEEIKIME